MLSTAITKGKVKLQGVVILHPQLLLARQPLLVQLLLVMLGAQAVQLQAPHHHLGPEPVLVQELAPGQEPGLGQGPEQVLAQALLALALERAHHLDLAHQAAQLTPAVLSLPTHTLY